MGYSSECIVYSMPKSQRVASLVCHTRGISQETKVVQNLDFCVDETVLVNRSVNRSSEEKIHAD